MVSPEEVEIENCVRQLSISFKFGEHGVLRDLLVRLRDMIKRYSMREDVSVSEKLVFFFDILPRISDLVNLARDTEYRSRLLLQVYHLILLISSFGRSNPGWRLLGGANILSSVLVGLPEWVPSIDISGLLSARRFREVHDFRYFLTISMGVYIECILTLESVDYYELLSWGNSAFYYGGRYVEFLDEVDLEVISRNSEDPYSVFRQCLFPLWNQFVFMHNLLRILGDHWPASLGTDFGFGIEGVVHYVRYLRGVLQDHLSLVWKIYRSSASGVSPDKSPHIIRLMLLEDFLGVYEAELEEYPKAEPDLSGMRQLLLSMLSRLEALDGSFDASTSYWTYYYDIFDLLLEIDCPDDVCKMVIRHRDRMVLLYYKYYRLGVLRGTPILDDDGLEFLKASLHYSTNEYIDVLILEALQMFGRGELKQFNDQVSRIEELGESKLVSPSLDLLRAYCIYLRTGDELHFPPLFRNPFDSNSWHFGYEIHGPGGVRRYYPFGSRLLKIQGFPLSFS